MDHALRFTSNDKDLKILNACRLYLGAVLVSEITSCEGAHLLLSAYQGVLSTESTIRGLTPYQDRPNETSWELWRRMLTEKVLSTSDPNPLALQIPLGRWFVTGTKTQRKWSAYYCPNTARLFIRESRNYRIFKNFANHFAPTTSVTLLVPSISVPVSVKTLPNGYKTILPYKSFVVTAPTPFPTTLTTFIEQLTPWESLLLRRFKLLCSPQDLSTHFSQALPMFLCSDGSAPSFRGSFGGLCSTPDGQLLFSISGPAPGYRTSSFRAESYGLLALLRFVVQICNFYSIELPTTLRFYTDSQSLVDTSYLRLEWTVEYPYSTMSADWDIQQSITSTIREFETPPLLLHVKGHQDRFQSIDSLSLPARLNIQADALAGQYQYPSDVSSTISPLITGATANLQRHTGTITNNYRHTLRRFASTPLICQFIKQKNNWTQDNFDSICWEIHGAVL